MNHLPCIPTCALFLGLAVLGACTGEAVEADHIDAELLFSSQTDTVHFEFDYASDAEPRVSLGPGQESRILDIFISNVEELFADQNKTLVFPESLDDMTDIGTFSDSSFTVDRIYEIATENRTQEMTENQAVLYVLYLNGYYHDGTEVREDVLGATLGESGIIAIFQPVVDASGDGDLTVPVYVQQATLTHEFGHAIGLVNRDIADQSEHHDSENGHHCINQGCVMHWSNEGPSAMANFVDGLGSPGADKILFGPYCLDDVKTLAGTGGE